MSSILGEFAHNDSLVAHSTILKHPILNSSNDNRCGPGIWLLDMVAEFPRANYIGIDITDAGFPTNPPPNCKFQIANVINPLPFRDESFDFVNFRNFVMALERVVWPKVLREIYRVLKPGGYIQVLGASITYSPNVNAEKYAGFILFVNIDGPLPYI